MALRFARLLTVAIATLACCASTRVDAGPIRFTITDLGLTHDPSTPARDWIDLDMPRLRVGNDGRTFYAQDDADGRYQTGVRWGQHPGDPDIAARVTDGVAQGIEGYLRYEDNLTVASGVNAAGWVVGWSGRWDYGIGPEFGHGFIAPPKTWNPMSIGNPIGTGPFDGFSRVYDINNGNDFVGVASVPGTTDTIHATLSLGLSQGSFDLNDLIESSGGLTMTVATGINDARMITGYARDSAGGLHRVLLTPTPVPEPAMLALFGAIAAMLGLRRSGIGRVLPFPVLLPGLPWTG